MVKKEFILGVGITAESKRNILEYYFHLLKNEKKQFYIVTPNPEILAYANSHLAYKDKLNNSAIALHDGSGLTLAGMIEGKKLGDRFPGVDFMEELCKACENPEFGLREKPLSMGFLGGRGGVAELAAKCLQEKYPHIKVVYAGEEWHDDKSKIKDQRSKIKDQISNGKSMENGKWNMDNKIDILFVAYGAPKQEEWIVEHLASLPVKSAIGVGGAFDYYSGNVKRAPRKVRAAGFEWLFRLISQPWRLKRQFALIIFIFLVCKERITDTMTISK
jgi:N-acetylglucosaminyldiphosphoundecaprenol N-acetyl-beta-D-mannosaminyltransferase